MSESTTLCSTVFDTLLRKRGLMPRTQQQEMIACASVAFETGNSSLIEAPTGVGKTIGYLVPGIAAAVVRKRRFIVSTATVALQEQLLSKDLPAVIQAYAAHGISVNVSILKGRGRYVCPLRLHTISSQGTLLDDSSAFAQNLQDAYEAGTWNGERETYSGLISGQDWSLVKNDRHTCIGDKCRLISKCPYYLNAETAKTATVVVANHDLVLNGIMRSKKSMFGEFAANIYAFDEGHHLPGKAASVFASTAPCDIDYMIPRVSDAMHLSGAIKSMSGAAITFVTLASERMKLIGKKLESGAKSHVVRFPTGIIPEDIRMLAEEAAAAVESLVADSLKGAVTRLTSHGRSASSPELIQISSLIGELSEIHEALLAFTEVDEGKPDARWIERHHDEWFLKVSPFDAGLTLRSMFWDEAKKQNAGIVITSATLLPLGNADIALREMGFAENSATVLMLSTPYADTYKNNVKFSIPAMRYKPDEYRAHTNEVAFNIIKEFGSDGGILCLFASGRQMRDVADMMPERIRDVMLVQGSMGHRALLDKHAEQIDRNGQSVIFGLATFAEGVDLPGVLCTKVIITKIPFPSPDDPLIAAACEWVEQKGINAFSTILLPKAFIVLKQSIGRLVRTETDYGEIIILDNRIMKKSYGKRLIDRMGLPLATC